MPDSHACLVITPQVVHFKHSGVPECATIFDPSRPCSLLPGARALHTGDSRPLEVDAGDLPPPEVGATGAGPKRRNSLGSAFAGFPHILHRGPSPVSDRASPDPLQHRRPPKLSSRDKRALRERQAADRGHRPKHRALDKRVSTVPDVGALPKFP